MTLNELQFQNTCIEYLKTMNSGAESNELQTIISRATIRFIKTKTFLCGNVWNQHGMDIELRVPIPLLKRTQELRSSMNELFEVVCPEDDEYGYGSLHIRPKMVGAEDLSYKEYDVVFDNIKQTIIQGIRDAKYVIWVAVAWFTNKEIFDELRKRKEDGISIRVITIGDKSNKWLLDDLDRTFDTTKIVLPNGHLFHHKFCIIDFEYVMHGSFNWSKNAEGNEETWATALDRDLTKKFADKFMKMYKDQYVDEADVIVKNHDNASRREEWEELF